MAYGFSGYFCSSFQFVEELNGMALVYIEAHKVAKLLIYFSGYSAGDGGWKSTLVVTIAGIENIAYFSVLMCLSQNK